MENYHKKLDFNTIVIIAIKENPGLFLPAKIEHIVEINTITPSGSFKSYQYNVKTANYEEKPFDNFNGTDTTFLEWDKLSYLDTINRFKSEQLYYVNKYL